jgi:multidrug efflux system membrane fusion protein
MPFSATLKTCAKVGNRSRIGFASFLLCGLAWLTCTGCGGGSKIQAAPAMPPPLVTTERAISQDVPIYLDEIGRNSAFESVTVMPQVDGRIAERHFQDGAYLKKGDLLFVIDPRPFQYQLDSAQANLAQQKAALELAKIQFDRAAGIVNTRAISQQDYDTRKNAVSVQETLVQAAQAAVENAKLNLEYCHIRSPIDGRAGARQADVGDTVKANTTALLSIRRIDPIYSNFTVTERDLPRVQAKMSHGGLKALVRVPSEPEAQARTAKVDFLDNSVQEATGTVGLRATVPNPDRQLWPGQFVNVKLILGVQKGAVLIPGQATQISQTGPFIFVVKPDNTVELRQLVLGQRQGEKLVVLEGVAAGEQVVTAGQMTLSPGATVRIDNSGPAPSSAAPGKPADE